MQEGPNNRSNNFNSNNRNNEGRTNFQRNPRRWYGAAVWPLSAVSNLNNPATGNAVENDMSQEELRAHAYLNRSNGNNQNASEHELDLLRKHQSSTSSMLLSDTFAHSLPASTEANRGFFSNKPAANPMFFFDRNQGMPSASHSAFTSARQSTNVFDKPNDPFQGSHTNNNNYGAFATNPFGGNVNGSAPQMVTLGVAVPPEPIAVNAASSSAQVAPPTKTNTVLTPQQENEFKSDHFTIGNVPEVAPPPEFYCF